MKDAAPEQVLGTLSLREVRLAADERAQLLERDVVAAEARNEGLLKRKNAVEEEIREKTTRRSSAASQRIRAGATYPAAADARRSAALRRVSAFRWTVPRANWLHLEQLLGDALLATWVTDADHADAVRRIIFRDYPEQSVAVITEADAARPSGVVEAVH